MTTSTTNSSTTPATLPELQSLQDSLSGLESALLAPVIAGELVTWTETVSDSFPVLVRNWIAYVKSVQRPQYKEIANTDSDLWPRVEQMNEEDIQLRQDMLQFEVSVREFAERAKQVQEDESKVTEGRKRVEQAGIDITLRIKKQLCAVAAWTQEAIYRDRGVGD